MRLAVVGGSSGIGLAVAARGAAAGWSVTVLSRDPGRSGLAVDHVTLDATDLPTVTGAFAELGPVDHLVWTASAPAVGRAREADLDAGRRAFDAKVFAPVAAIQAGEIRSSIVLTSGVAAAVPSVGAFFTGAVNGAVEAAVRGLARELAPVRVNAVAPGMIDTPLYGRMPEEARRAMFDRAAGALPVGRVGAAEDVAAGVWYLLTDEFVTGTVLEIDGGTRIVGA